jgi:putative endonuclease
VFWKRLAQSARSWWFDLAHHPEPVEGPFGWSQGRQATANPDKAEIESNGATSLSRGFCIRQLDSRADLQTLNLVIGAPMHYVYILRCADDSFYVGSTQDIDSRVQLHNDGRGAAYTFKHCPVRLVYSEVFDSEAKAVRRERQLKHWSHGKKQALVDGNIQRLTHLSKRRQ